MDRCASGIWELWHDSLSGKKIDHAMIAKALDVVGKRGKGNAFSAYGSPIWMFLADMVGLYMREGDKESFAIEDVAKRYDSTKSTVRRAWKRFQAEYPELVNEIMSFTKTPIS